MKFEKIKWGKEIKQRKKYGWSIVSNLMVSGRYIINVRPMYDDYWRKPEIVVTDNKSEEEIFIEVTEGNVVARNDIEENVEIPKDLKTIIEMIYDNRLIVGRQTIAEVMEKNGLIHQSKLDDFRTRVMEAIFKGD
jgi:hypothetical protein